MFNILAVLDSICHSIVYFLNTLVALEYIHTIGLDNTLETHRLILTRHIH